MPANQCELLFGRHLFAGSRKPGQGQMHRSSAKLVSQTQPRVERCLSRLHTVSLPDVCKLAASQGPLCTLRPLSSQASCPLARSKKRANAWQPQVLKKHSRTLGSAALSSRHKAASHGTYHASAKKILLQERVQVSNGGEQERFDTCSEPEWQGQRCHAVMQNPTVGPTSHHVQVCETEHFTDLHS